MYTILSICHKNTHTFTHICYDWFSVCEHIDIACPSSFSFISSLYNAIPLCIFYQQNNSLCVDAFWHNYIFISVFISHFSFLVFCVHFSLWVAFYSALLNDFVSKKSASAKKSVLKLNYTHSVDDDIILTEYKCSKRKLLQILSTNATIAISRFSSSRLFFCTMFWVIDVVVWI